MFDRRLVQYPALSIFIAVAAGCQSGDTAKVLDTGDQPKPAQQKVTEAELRGFCPRVTLRDGTAYFNTYARGGQDDPTKVVYQASISDVSRACTTTDGLLTMKVAVAGRVVPGPAFAAGTIDMPIRIVAVHGSEVLYSQIHHYKVNISDPTAATQFIFSDPDVSFALPADRAVQVYAGYDEGPKKRN